MPALKRRPTASALPGSPFLAYGGKSFHRQSHGLENTIP